MGCNFYNKNGLDMLREIKDKTVDLVLTDPPYVISKDSGMNKVFNGEESKYGKKYAIQTDYGEWDSEFTIDDLEKFISEFYRILKKGGSCIIFFDIWKIETLSNLLKKYGFSKIRFIEWIKTNPVPINSKATYLNNAREIAVSCVKGSGQTFNSKYDNGIYKYPIYQGIRDVDRIHPTQKSLELFEEIIQKHSKRGDLIVDPFGGSGTTYIASNNTNRNCESCEIDPNFYKKASDRIEWRKKKSPNFTADESINLF